MSTLIVLAVVILLVYMAIRTMIRDHRNGRSISCGGSCAQCHGGCHANLKKEIDRLRNAG